MDDRLVKHDQVYKLSRSKEHIKLHVSSTASRMPTFTDFSFCNLPTSYSIEDTECRLFPSILHVLVVVLGENATSTNSASLPSSTNRPGPSSKHIDRSFPGYDFASQSLVEYVGHYYYCRCWLWMFSDPTRLTWSAKTTFLGI